MHPILIDEINKLSIPERIQIVEDIWDGIALENEFPELTEEQRLELDKRIASFRENPNLGRSWEEIKSEYLNKP